MNTMLKRVLALVAISGSLALFQGTATADDGSGLSADKQTKLGLYMTAKQAYDYMMDDKNKALFLDIRTPGELNYLGAASVMDFHVPMYYMDRSQWDDKKHRYVRAKNENFIADIADRLQRKGLAKDDTVILMCRSGKRSAKAVDMLADAGYTKVYTVVDGYEGDKAKEGADKGKRVVNGWKNSGLPWTYSLDKDLMYFIKE